MSDRAYWLSVLERLARPVLTALSEGKLREKLPLYCKPGLEAGRATVTHLEAVGRLLAGIAPWLELDGLTGAEKKLQDEFRSMTIKGIDAGTNPDSPDLLNFKSPGQPLVDAAFLSHAMLRAPRQLWGVLDSRVRKNLAACLASVRITNPPFNNWLLFAATVETALAEVGEWWDRMRVDYAIRQHEQWYKGDSAYGDGPNFHFDYYNSFVIQPMLLDVVERGAKREKNWERYVEPIRKRAVRYAQVQEFLIAPDGTFPPIGRSICYRGGAFQHLAMMALRKELPEVVSPEQVRCALTAVMKRTIEAPGTFDEQGWLQIGLVGKQLGLGEPYISTGSLYLASFCLLPLGLSESEPFWSGPAKDWTSKKIWAGVDAPADHAMAD